MQALRLNEKYRFFLSNLLKGFVWLAVIIVLVLLARKYINVEFKEFLEPFFSRALLIIGIFTFSEVFFGIIPPELFMFWAARFESLSVYAGYILLFASISYISGIIGFFVGKYLSNTLYYRYIRKRLMGKYHSLLRKYGYFIILVAALTPLPYSALSLLMGSLDYPLRNYLFVALARFIRFFVYSAIIWKTNFI
ncbi:MAG: VTT domain-containing protein [Bacteroidales bacterium]|nr:VTT domain-containing protein [Bacteroidales bacterium]